MLVYLGVIVETRGMIDLEEVGLELLVDQNVKTIQINKEEIIPKELKARAIPSMCRRACLVAVCKLWLHREQSLNDHVFDAYFQLIDVMTGFL